VLQQWEREKQDWLTLRGQDVAKHWSVVVPTLGEKDRADFHRRFNRVREDFLDTSYGRCLLRRPEPSVSIMCETTASLVITVEGKEVEEGWREQGCWE